jgi:hypothetical protein
VAVDTRSHQRRPSVAERDTGLPLQIGQRRTEPEGRFIGSRLRDPNMS